MSTTVKIEVKVPSGGGGAVSVNGKNGSSGGEPGPPPPRRAPAPPVAEVKKLAAEVRQLKSALKTKPVVKPGPVRAVRIKKKTSPPKNHHGGCGGKKFDPSSLVQDDCFGQETPLHDLTGGKTWNGARH